MKTKWGKWSPSRRAWSLALNKMRNILLTRRDNKKSIWNSSGKAHFQYLKPFYTFIITNIIPSLSTFLFPHYEQKQQKNKWGFMNLEMLTLSKRVTLVRLRFSNNVLHASSLISPFNVSTIYRIVSYNYWHNTIKDKIYITPLMLVWYKRFIVYVSIP